MLVKGDEVDIVMYNHSRTNHRALSHLLAGVYAKGSRRSEKYRFCLYILY